MKFWPTLHLCEIDQTRDLDQTCNFEPNPARDTESLQTVFWAKIWTPPCTGKNGGHGLALCRNDKNTKINLNGIVSYSNTTLKFKAAEDFCKSRKG